MNRLSSCAGMLLVGCVAAAASVAHAQEPAVPEKDQTLPPVPVEERRPAPAPLSREDEDLRRGYIPWDSDRITSDGQRVGTYNQPVWTTQRPFPTTRVFVQP